MGIDPLFRRVVFWNGTEVSVGLTLRAVKVIPVVPVWRTVGERRVSANNTYARRQTVRWRFPRLRFGVTGAFSLERSTSKIIDTQENPRDLHETPLHSPPK